MVGMSVPAHPRTTGTVVRTEDSTLKIGVQEKLGAQLAEK
jgi:hypothetical protein